MIRDLVKFTIERPIFNHILFVLLLIMAFFSYKSIPKEIFPPVELDKITINGAYIGTSASVLDKMAVKPIEDELKNVNNISNIQSVIRNGVFSIRADIKPGANNQVVLSDIKDAIATVKRDLPSDMNEPIARIFVAHFPLILIAISGDVPKKRLLDAAKVIKDRLSDIKALDEIDIRGDADEEVSIEINDKKLQAYGIPRKLFYGAVMQLSSIYPAGSIKKDGKLIYISSSNGAKDAKALGETILHIGKFEIKLKDVANVRYGLGDPKTISHFNGKQNISINITKSKQGNAIALSKQIKKMLPSFAKKYPDLEFKTYTDTSIWIKNRINLVTTNIMFGLILVFLALFLSVNWRIATVVALGIPTSFFIALIGAEMLGYSINMLTMLGALIALGMIVDEAIVVAENIYRHMEMGKPPKEAAIDGSVEMFPAVLTATMTTVFAFLPLLIMSGQIGIFVKVLPVMISILLLSSIFEAFFFLPLHSKELFSFGKIIDHHEPAPIWDKIGEKYAQLLNFLLEYKKISLLIIVFGILISTFGMFKILKYELFPTFDSTYIYVGAETDPNNKLKDTEKVMSLVEKNLLKVTDFNETSSITSIAGIKINPDQTFESGDHLFQIVINLHERKPENFFDKYINPYFSLEYDDSDMLRSRDSHDILKDIDKNIISKIKDMRDDTGKKLFKEISAYVPQTGIVKHDIEIGLSGVSDKKIFTAIKKLENKLHSIDGMIMVDNNAKEGPKELKLKINNYGYRLGFTEESIISTLRGLFLDAQYGKMFSSKGLIRIKIKDPTKNDNYDISSLSVSTPDGSKRVMLKDIVNFVYKNRMLKIYKESGEKVWSVMATVDKKVILPTEVMKKITPLLNSFRKEGIKVIIKGEQKENNQMKREMSEAAIIALFLIFISLVLMFNSLVLPLIVLSVIPLSILGALIGTYLFGINLSMIGLMGIIGLAGVVVNDGLIMLDFIKGEKLYGNIIEKAKIRLRPIFLTSITTVLGLMTIMFFASGQSLIVQPMAISLGFGVAWATFLNLVYIPVIYAVVYRAKEA